MKADGLANIGYAFKIHPDMKIHITYATSPTIENIEEEMALVQDLGPKDINPDMDTTYPSISPIWIHSKK